MLNTLNVSQTGLNAARIAVENVSNNIANANTEGYKKRVVQLSELDQMDSRFTGRGVNASGSYRITSQYMYDKLISENSKTNYYEKLSGMLSNVESVFSETLDSGFSADLNRFFQSIEDLRSNPNSEIYKSTLNSQASILVGSLQNLYSSVEQQQSAEKDELYANVSNVNDILTEIGSINEKLANYNGSNNDLLDKRDALELELSNYADISVDRREDFYELKIAGQTLINNTNVKTIDVLENNTNQIDKFYNREFNPNGTFQIKDAIKYNTDGTSKSLDTNDVVTYQLNNQSSVSATIGESIFEIIGTDEVGDPIYKYDSTGNKIPVDLDGDPSNGIDNEVTQDNLIRALVYKINTNSDMKNSVTAYNGDYVVDSSGNKTTNNGIDGYLRIESNFGGTNNSFDGQISIQKVDNNDPSIVENREVLYRNEDISSDSESELSLGILDKEINLKSGILKAQVENLSSTSVMNKYQSYFDKLDAFAQTLSDVYEKFTKDENGDYIYGESASQNTGTNTNSILATSLFSGSNVKTLKFNADSINNLDQEKLDYLATIQWKTDLKYDGLGQDSTSNTKSSFTEFFRELKVSVAADKENTNFLKETQNSVEQSIQSSYNQLTKVDKDEEMLNLIKFQAAYTANAKIVTAIDEMIQTLLGM